MTPKEKTFREILKLEAEIAERRAQIEKLQNKAVKHSWATLEIVVSLRSPDKKWWQENQPELFAEMQKHYKSSNSTRIMDGGFKAALKKQIAYENL
ncbi:MAG: hypothetical protein ACO23H_17390 [Alphaproteobacteria bacterium]